tara:strand:- start:3062 stop:3472 length:411 start_codon:yes stop_codon:yes gene_type:complete
MAYTIKISAGDTKVSAKGFFIKDGRVLLVKPTGSENKYDIPGGKIKVGESKEQGLYRECLEEIGLKIKKAKKIGEDKEREKIYFIVSEWNGEITLQLEEIEKYRWVPVGEVQNYSLTRTAYNGLVHYLLIELNGRV